MSPRRSVIDGRHRATDCQSPNASLAGTSFGAPVAELVDALDSKSSSARSVRSSRTGGTNKKEGLVPGGEAFLCPPRNNAPSGGHHIVG